MHRPTSRTCRSARGGPTRSPSAFACGRRQSSTGCARLCGRAGRFSSVEVPVGLAAAAVPPINGARLVQVWRLFSGRGSSHSPRRPDRRAALKTLHRSAAITVDTAPAVACRYLAERYELPGLFRTRATWPSPTRNRGRPRDSRRMQSFLKAPACRPLCAPLQRNRGSLIADAQGRSAVRKS